METSVRSLIFKRVAGNMNNAENKESQTLGKKCIKSVLSVSKFVFMFWKDNVKAFRKIKALLFVPFKDFNLLDLSKENYNVGLLEIRERVQQNKALSAQFHT